MTRVAKSLVLVLCGAFLGCGGATASGSASTTAAVAPTGPSIVVTEDMGHPHPGEAAPDFTLTDQNGQSVSLSQYRGKVVVLTFATSWCPFSQAEQATLADLPAQYAGRDVQVLVVDIDEEDAGYQRYLARHAMTEPVLRDARAAQTLGYVPEHAQPSFTDRWKVIVSSNLVIDQQGIVRFYTLADTLHFDAQLVNARAVVDQLLAAPPAAPTASAGVTQAGG